MEKDIRWLQRFNNFEKAYNFLITSARKNDLSELEKAGLIHGFEFTFELAWKTLKDFMEYKNVLVRFPRDVIKEAFKHDLILNGEVWIDMLEKRNLMAHTYDDEKADIAVSLIKNKYCPEISQIYNMLKKET